MWPNKVFRNIGIQKITANPFIAPQVSYFSIYTSHIVSSWASSRYFEANSGMNGTELWVTDGMSEGTMIAEDILPGDLLDSFPGEFA
jgi:ELWxxDGT repeat protein